MKSKIANILLISWLSLQKGRPTALAWSFCRTKRHPDSSPSSAVSRHYVYRSNSNADLTNSQQHLTSIAEQSFAILARRKKTWQRLRHLVELAQDVRRTQTNDDNSCRSIADVGTDHGILPIALASTGHFDRVVGVDISEKVLEGARSLYNKVQSNLLAAETSPPLSVDFVLGDGLSSIQGTMDMVCIAGMGVNTMLEILTPTDLDRVGCRVLLLQPTNSKPKNLLRLYDTLWQSGWHPVDEKIEYQSSRWYLSIMFCRSISTVIPDVSKSPLPGSILRLLVEKDDGSGKKIFHQYVKHHTHWIQMDWKAKGSIDETELRWMSEFVQS